MLPTLQRNLFRRLASSRYYGSHQQLHATAPFSFVKEVLLPTQNANHYFIDARSPSEFAEDHIPGAKNWYVLDDAQRHQVGLLHKEDKFSARKLGAALISQNIANHIVSQPELYNRDAKFTVYCARGQQRSQSLAHVLGKIGYMVNVLESGYKTYREQVIQGLKQFMEQIQLKIVIISGPTGSGKTLLLRKLRELGAQVLDIEHAAMHFGSILGELDGHATLSHKTFEANLYWQLASQQVRPENGPLFIESESKRIGKFHLPDCIWKRMTQNGEEISSTTDPASCRHFSVVFVRCTDLKHRVEHIRREYAHLEAEHKQQLLLEKISILAARLPCHQQQTAEQWAEQVKNGEFDTLVGELIEKHYDPAYQRASSSYQREYNTNKPNHFLIEHNQPINEQTYAQLAQQVMCTFTGTPKNPSSTSKI